MKAQFKKGDKILTRENKVETVLRINSNGNIETVENDYSWPASSVTLAESKAARLLSALKENGYVKRYYDTRNSGKKYFETIVCDKKEDGNYKRYESASKADIGILQNAYLTETEVLQIFNKD